MGAGFFQARIGLHRKKNRGLMPITMSLDHACE